MRFGTILINSGDFVKSVSAAFSLIERMFAYAAYKEILERFYNMSPLLFFIFVLTRDVLIQRSNFTKLARLRPVAAGISSAIGPSFQPHVRHFIRKLAT